MKMLFCYSAILGFLGSSVRYLPTIYILHLKYRIHLSFYNRQSFQTSQYKEEWKTPNITAKIMVIYKNAHQGSSSTFRILFEVCRLKTDFPNVSFNELIIWPNFCFELLLMECCFQFLFNLSFSLLCCWMLYSDCYVSLQSSDWVLFVKFLMEQHIFVFEKCNCRTY